MSRIRDHIALLIEVTSVGWLFLFSGCGAGSVDYSKNLGNGYIYHSNSSLDRFIAPETWNDDTPMIPSKVVRYKNNGKYVTAKREIIQKGRSGSRIASGIFDYWILNTEFPEVFGPMDKSRFDLQIEELGLPFELRLD